MDKITALSQLKSHEAELRRMGVASLSLFGSTARGEAGPGSDIDLAATFADEAHVGLFAFAGIAARLHDLLGVHVDLVGEPARKPAMQAQIDRDRVRVF
jgi:predicted nucleotidyltransferase